MDRHPCIRIYGKCSYGDKCKFANAKRNVCLYWLRGKCKNTGSDEPCRFGKHPNKDIAILSTEMKNRCRECPIGVSCKRTCNRSHDRNEMESNYSKWERFMTTNWDGFRTIPCRNGFLCKFKFCTYKHVDDDCIRIGRKRLCESD